MATPPRQPWTPHDKAFLLAEIIKQYTGPRWEFLFEVIRQNNVQPQWEDVVMPPGRTLAASRLAFEEMQMQRSMTIPPPQPQSMSIPTTPSPYLPGPTGPTGKRLYGGLETSLGVSNSGREIRPKPMTVAPTTYPHPSASEPPPKRKRGRPTKAETQARGAVAAAAAAAVVSGSSMPPQSLGERPITPAMATPVSHIYSGPYDSSTPHSMSARGPISNQPSAIQPSSAPPPVREETKPYVPTTRLPVADMLTPSAPSNDPPRSQSGSSSGKRRRARSTNKSETQESPSAKAAGDRPAYESPYARVDVEDTPARAALLRHRETDPVASPRSAPPEHGTEQRGGTS